MVQGAKLALENGGGNPDSALLNPALKECLYIKTTCISLRISSCRRKKYGMYGTGFMLYENPFEIKLNHRIRN